MNITLQGPLEVKLASTQPEPRWFTPARSRWEVLRDYELSISHREQNLYTKKVDLIVEDFVVPRGFEFDGASIPWVLWWRFQPTYVYVFEPSAFHDYCYQELYRHYTKDFADEAFRQMMLLKGAPAYQAHLFHTAVSVFGKGGW